MSRYVITPERSQVWIDARSNVHPIHSATDGLEGYVDIELSAEGEVNVQATMSGQLTLSVDRLTSGNRLEDRELAKRIDAKRFPTITGILGTIATSDAAGTYKVAGDITFRGVTQHHADIMNISSVDEATIQLDGQSRFDIREFGMEPPRMLMLKVEPEVDIRVAIVAVRESGA